MGTPAAIRQRRYRDRQREGKISLCIDVDEFALFEALVAAGFLSPDDDSRQSLETALAHVVELWVSSVTHNCEQY
jgi:hypothetical protein